MALKKELQELVDELEFDSPEDKTEFEKYLAKEKLGAAIEARVMKNKDYTTKTQQLANAKKQLETEQARWNEEQDSYLGTLNAYKGDLEKRASDLVTQVSKSKLYGAALETKLQKLATEYGLDFDELMADVKEARTAEPPKKDAPAFDEEAFNKRFVPRDEFQTTAEHVFSFAPMLRDLDREYHRLYGKEYDGSMYELVKQGTVEVNQRRARGQKVDLYDYMREKLDFAGQKARNDETAKTKAVEDQKKWEEDKAKEIETRLRSELLASNPGLSRQTPNPDEWRGKLSAADRQNKETTRTVPDTVRRQQEIHRKYEEQAAKNNAA